MLAAICSLLARLLPLLLTVRVAGDKGKAYELHRFDPIAVGHERTITTTKGSFIMRTISLKPAAFVIDDFLTPKECDELVSSVGSKQPSRGMFRESNQAWIDQGKPGTSQLLKDLRDRVYEVIKLPRFVVEDSEPLQVLQYHPGGHYHTHHDSVPGTPRYLTFLYYLTEVEAGGETCFPLADTEYEAWEEDRPTPEDWSNIVGGVEDRWNLSFTENCHRSAYVTPKKGRAILFYNHLSARCFEGQQWGCELGEMDKYSMHGGCDVLRGVKWSANNWINVLDDPYKVDGPFKAARADAPVVDTITLPHKHREL